MTELTRGVAVALLLTAGVAGCTSPYKRPLGDTYKPLTVAPPKTTLPAKDPGFASGQPTGRNGSMSVPVNPTSGGTLRPMASTSPAIDPPVLPTVQTNTAPPSMTGMASPDLGMPTPPPPTGGITPVDSKSIAPPSPPAFETPKLPN